MKDSIFEILDNSEIALNTCRMVLAGDTSEIAGPGQFVNIRLDGFYLRRPISVCNADEKSLTLIYKTVGRGTEKMSAMAPGEKLQVLTGLGNGYNLDEAGQKPLLIGGGAGVPPMYMLAQKLAEKGCSVQVVLGFNSAAEVFYEKEFLELGCSVTVATADGSYGSKGFVTDVLPDEYSCVFTCGPEPMLRAVYRQTTGSGQFSFEERMGCGFGACMGCSCRTLTGYKRICKDGPVLHREEILWED